jgi:hypothetical protein
MTRKISCIVLYNINDKDTTNIVSLQMNVGFNTYLTLNYMASTIHQCIGKICVAKCDEENGQIIIICTGYCYENLCSVQYHRQENKT